MHKLNVATVIVIIAAFTQSIETPLLGQTKTIAVEDRRPIVAVLDQLEALFGVPINYEDVPYENSMDVEDISTPQQRASFPGYHLVVPRVGKIEFGIVDTNSPITNVLGSLTNLVAAYHANALPGQFVVGESNGVFSVAAVTSRDSSGKQKDVVTPLADRVMIPEATRTTSDTVATVLGSISKASGVNVVLGTFPFPFAPKLTLGSNGEPGSVVLANLFGKLTSRPISYRLLFDPSSKGYMLNLQILTRKSDYPAISSTPLFARFSVIGSGWVVF